MGKQGTTTVKKMGAVGFMTRKELVLFINNLSSVILSKDNGTHTLL